MLRRSDEDGAGAGLLGPWTKASPIFSLLAVLVYSAAGDFAGGSTFWSVLAVGGVAAAASLIVGALLGFLFGLPRTLEQEGSTATLVTNTNLDQISDWLTKILIGLGLVQLGKVASGIDDLALAIAPGLGGGVGAHSFAVALLIYAAVDGFLVGYLWTRIVLSAELKKAADNLRKEADKLAIVKDTDQVLSSNPPAPPPPLPTPPGGTIDS